MSNSSAPGLCHMTLADRLAAFKKLAAKATPGPWRAWRAGNAPLKVGGCGQSELKPLERPYNPRFVGYRRADSADAMHRKVMLKDADADYIASLPDLLKLTQDYEQRCGEQLALLKKQVEWHRMNDDNGDFEGSEMQIELDAAIAKGETK